IERHDIGDGPAGAAAVDRHTVDSEGQPVRLIRFEGAEADFATREFVFFAVVDDQVTVDARLLAVRVRPPRLRVGQSTFGVHLPRVVHLGRTINIANPQTRAEGRRG